MTDGRVIRQFDRMADEVIICCFHDTQEIVAICGVCSTQLPDDDSIIRRWKEVDPILDEVHEAAEKHFREVPHEG